MNGVPITFKPHSNITMTIDLAASDLLFLEKLSSGKGVCKKQEKEKFELGINHRIIEPFLDVQEGCVDIYYSLNPYGKKLIDAILNQSNSHYEKQTC
jgi:hypothetical protein